MMEEKFYDMRKFDEKAIAKAGALAGAGLTQKQIADYFEISLSTFKNKIVGNPDLKRAMKKGRSSRIAHVSGKLMQLIDSGNVTAIIFYLKTQGRWKEAQEHSIDEDDDESMAVKLELGTCDPIEASKIYQQLMSRGE
jgi:DNA-binding CsgD family transcriptional regulator